MAMGLATNGLSPRFARRFLERLDALNALVKDPVPAQRRMAQWLARAHMSAHPGTRTTPLRPGPPPGYRIAHALAPEEDVLMQVHALACGGLSPARSPPHMV